MSNQPERTILIADDDSDLTAGLAMRCRDLGYNVFTAHDAFIALMLIRTHRPDIVCLDVNMPGGNGLSVSEMLITDNGFPNLPIIVLTGDANPDTIRRCHSLGLFYVEKCNDVWPRIKPILEELSEPESLSRGMVPPGQTSHELRTNRARNTTLQGMLHHG